MGEPSIARSVTFALRDGFPSLLKILPDIVTVFAKQRSITKYIYNKYLEAGKVLDVSLITVKSEKLSFSLIKRKLLTI